MSNPSGSFATLQDPNGIVIQSGGQSYVAGATLRSALTGTLTLTGVCNLDGQPAAWVIGAGSTGWQSPAGNSGGICNQLGYAYSNSAADAGKALLMWTPR